MRKALRDLITQSPKRTNDTAKGPLAGYLFQFEKALLALAELKNSEEYIAIEEVDDVSTHTPDGTVLLTVQGKHSISNSGSTFGDTSTALWRTLEIWITKLELSIFTEKTIFICATNKPIHETALLRKLTTLPFEEALAEVLQLLKSERAKLKKLQAEDPKAGNSVKEIIRLIKLAIKKKDSLRIVLSRLQIEDNEEVRVGFLNRLHLGSPQVTELQRQRIYEEYYGWMIHGSKARWLNGKEARFTKKNFDEKWALILSNPAIVAAIFRTKESLGSLTEHEILAKKKELFVRQIEDIKRNKEGKARIIREAIINFIYTDIEIKHVVDKGDYTEEDFDVFLKQCRMTWQTVYDTKVLKDLEEYSEDEKNVLAINIFDTIMHDIKVEFKEGFCFTTSNMYVKNGCFLRLSNEPSIGWHPEWESKYKTDEKS